MTPMLAVVDGTLDWLNLTGKLSSYNGLPYYNILLRGDDGNDYFYIHLNNDTPGTDDGQGGVQNAYAPGSHQRHARAAGTGHRLRRRQRQRRGRRQPPALRDPPRRLRGRSSGQSRTRAPSIRTRASWPLPPWPNGSRPAGNRRPLRPPNRAPPTTTEPPTATRRLSTTTTVKPVTTTTTVKPTTTTTAKPATTTTTVNADDDHHRPFRRLGARLHRRQDQRLVLLRLRPGSQRRESSLPSADQRFRPYSKSLAGLVRRLPGAGDGCPTNWRA